MSTKIDFNSLYASEKLRFDALAYKETPLTTIGALSFTSISSGASYNSSTGENGLILLLQALFASSNITASDFNSKAEGSDLVTTNGNVTSLSNTVTSHLADNLYKTATGTATAITLTISETLVTGLPINFIASADNGAVATTINGKKLFKPVTVLAPTLKAGKPYIAYYNAAGDSGNGCFFLKASATGTATPAQVLATVPYSNETDTDLIGTMINLSGVYTSTTLAGINGTQIIIQLPNGFSDGIAGTYCYIIEPNFLTANILSGKSILGLTGSAKRSQTGSSTTTSASGYPITVTGLSFTPRLIKASFQGNETLLDTAKSATINYYLGSAATASPCSVNSSGFVLATGSGTAGTSVSWEAFE